MRISVITITYQSVHTLQQAIESVLNQTFQDIEYIVVDGGSNDGTRELLASYGSKITWVSEPDRGIYHAMNKGIDMAKGDYVGFLHADDVYADSKVLSDIANALNEHRPDALYGDLEYVSKDNPSKVIRYWKSCRFTPSFLKKGWMPPHPTLYIKKDCYQRIGGFNESFRIASDYDFILRLFGHTNINVHYLNRLIVKMRVGGASNRSIGNILRKMMEDYRALKNNGVGGFYALVWKNMSKMSQLVKRK